MRNNYVLSSWVSSCLQGFRMAGWNEQNILCEAKIDSVSFEKSYFDVPPVYEIFSVAEQLYGKSVGLMSRLGLVPNTFQSLSLAVLSAPDFGYGLRLMADYSAYISNAVSYDFDASLEHPEFSFSLSEEVKIHPRVIDAMFASTLRTFRFIQPRSAFIREVHMRSPVPDNESDYDDYFRAPIRWSQEKDAILLNRDCLSLPSIHANPTILAQHEKDCQETIGKLQTSSFVQRIKKQITSMLNTGDSTVDGLAFRLNMSTRSLQRRLSKENTSFSLLLESIRQQESKQLLETSNESISSIAQCLGFTDSGNFSRAFKRWFNCSPEAYRKKQQL